MPHTSQATFTAESAVELAVLERSGFIESRHLGSAVVISGDGHIVTSLGDIKAPVFARSTLKPFQALASMRAGVPLRGAQVALASASHVGSFEHQEVVTGMLRAGGNTEAELQCPPDWPQDEQARAWMLRKELGKSRLCMNCSGKHAAFLWACTENGWPKSSYLDASHPLQRLVNSVIEEYTGERIAGLGVDGCGAPVAAVSLTGLARAYSTLAQAPGNHAADARAATIATSMLDYPWAVQGADEPNSVVMEKLETIAKLGAEGVTVMAAPNGTAVALKILDGSLRAASLVGLTLLTAAGALDAARVAPVLEQIVEPVKGGEKVVGRIRLGAPVASLLEVH